MGLYADQSIPFTLIIHTTAEIKPSFVIKQRECGVCFSIIHAIKVPVALNALYELYLPYASSTNL
jgi:hypothetical protein